MDDIEQRVFFSTEEVSRALNIKHVHSFARKHNLTIQNGHVPASEIPKWQAAKERSRYKPPPIKKRFY
jgi:hypothetical protein